MTRLDADLLNRIKQGDDNAFTTIVEDYQTPVYNLCYRMLGTREEAEDAAQETFWRAYQGIEKYDSERSFSTWLLSIAAHYCIDQQRRRKLPTFSMEILPEGNIPDGIPTPEKSVGISQEEEQIHRIVFQLQPNDRAAVILRYWYDFSEKEISDTLSLSVSAVKSRLHRARKQLSTLWMSAQEKQLVTGEG